MIHVLILNLFSKETWLLDGHSLGQGDQVPDPVWVKSCYGKCVCVTPSTEYIFSVFRC